MGQQFTKSVVGRLEQGMQRYRTEMEKDIIRTIQEKHRLAKNKNNPGGFTDPNAMDGGFQRGLGPPIRQDIEQEAFLKSQQQQDIGNDDNNNNTNLEMSEDLIKFLQDMGPVVVQRKPSTGPRVRKHELMEEQQEPTKLEQQGSNSRQIREMPIMQETPYFTTRTTNFSRTKEQEDPFGLTGRELYRLLQQKEDVDVAVAAAVVAATSTTTTQVQNANENEKQKEYYSNLLHNSIKYLQVPVIMKDTDDTYVGTWPESVADMKLMKLTVVPESQVRILLAVEDPHEEKDKKKASSHSTEDVS
jgi:hypothetical protein